MDDTFEENYPECNKLDKVGKEFGAIERFVEWLAEEKQVYLMTAENEDNVLRYAPSTKKLVEEFYGIDAMKLETERRAMLDALDAIRQVK